MRVPVRRLPQTRVSEQQQGYARAAPGLDISPITNALSSGVDVVEGFRAQLKDEQRNRQKFDINRRIMNEVNELQEDFEIRRRDPEVSPVDFADTVDTAYQARHKALTDELYGEGFDRDLVEDLEIKLGGIRQGFFAKGLSHQLDTLRSRAQTGAEDITQRASQYVASNPDGYKSGRDMLQESIRLAPDLTEEEKEALIKSGLGILRDAGGKALAIQNPQFVIDTLDPQGFTSPFKPSVVGKDDAVNVEGLDSDRSTVAATLSAGGLPPAVVAGFLGNFDVEAGYGGAQGDGGTASGIAQWRKERRDNFKSRFGKEPHQATKEEQAQFVLWELANPGAAGMTAAQVSAIRTADTAEGAAELIDKFYERSSGKHRSQRKLAAAEYGRSISAPAPAQETVPAETAALAPSVNSIEDAQTGNALLDDMNGPERLQLLGWAREQLNKVNASRKAEMDVAIDNYIAEVFANGGESGTPFPSQEEVLKAYADNPLEGAKQVARLQQAKDSSKAIVTFRTQSADNIQRGLNAIKPEPGSPNYAAELQIYEAAERAAQHLLKERDDDPAAYALKYFPSVAAAAKKSLPAYYAEVDRVYESLGIDSGRAPLLSGDAARQMAQDYKLMSPADRLTFMRENFSGMGEDRFRRFVSNMEGTTAQDDARIFALFRSYPRPNQEWATMFQEVLEGREIMAKDPARRPSPELVNKSFQAQGLSAIKNLNADASSAIQEAAAALYVARGGDPKTINTSMYRESLRIALGGSLPANLQRGEVKDYTILPPRVDKKKFQSWMERQTFESLTHMSVERRPPRYGDLKTLVQTEDIVDHGVFVMAAPGQYMIKMSTDGKRLMTSTGQPFIVNIRTEDINASINAKGGGW
jgi:hypothetical protein